MNIKVHISSASGSAYHDPVSLSYSPPASPLHQIHRLKLTTSSVDDQGHLDSGFSDGSSPTASVSVEPYHYYYHQNPSNPSDPKGDTH